MVCIRSNYIRDYGKSTVIYHTLKPKLPWVTVCRAGSAKIIHGKITYRGNWSLTLTLLNATECTNSKKLLQIVALSRQGIFARLTHSVAFSRRGVCYTTWILLRNSRIPHCILLHLAWFMFRNTAFCCI